MNKNIFPYTPQLDYLPPEKLRIRQNKFLRDQLSFCQKKSPFYRNLFRKMKFDKFTIEDIPSLPFTDKSMVAKHNLDFLATPMSQIEDIVFSSGTTGRPSEIAYSASDLDRLAYNEHRALAIAGVVRSDIVHLTCTIDRCFIAGLAYYLGTRQIGATAIRNGINSLESHAEVIDRLHPTVLIGVPSFLRNLGLFLHDNKISTDSIRRLICIGEPIRTNTLATSPVGKQLRQVWSVPLHSTYASSEIVTSFCECSAECGGHLIPELVYPEIIDDNGNVLPDGTPGELVLTQFRTTGMPLVRFRTGDITFKVSEKCQCGRLTPRIGPIIGRKEHMLKFKGTTLYPQALFSVLDDDPAVSDYYIVASGENLSDKIDVFVAMTKPGTPVDSLAPRLKAVCRVNIPIHECPAEEIRKQVFSVSRKPVRFFDKRTKNG